MFSHYLGNSLCFQIGGTDAVYRVVIDPPGEVVADVGAETCTGEMCRYIYSSNTLTNSSTVSVDVVGCVTERMDATDISTRKITPVYAFNHVVAPIDCSFQFLQSVILKTC